jgi:hypothetical protein
VLVVWWGVNIFVLYGVPEFVGPMWAMIILLMARAEGYQDAGEVRSMRCESSPMASAISSVRRTLVANLASNAPGEDVKIFKYNSQFMDSL